MKKKKGGATCLGWKEPSGEASEEWSIVIAPRPELEDDDCMTMTIRYATAKSRPCGPKASGIASAAMNIAPIATGVAPATSASVGLSVFVSHAYADHAHQSAISSKMP